MTTSKPAKNPKNILALQWAKIRGPCSVVLF